jgi:hypothetical protein
MEESEYSVLYVYITLQISIFVGAYMFNKINGYDFNYKNHDDDDYDDDVIIFG